MEHRAGQSYHMYLPTHVFFAKGIYLLQENRAQERNRNGQNSKRKDKNVMSEFTLQKYMARAFQIVYICGRRFYGHWFAGLTWSSKYAMTYTKKT